jgi:HEAT repeat protein
MRPDLKPKRVAIWAGSIGLLLFLWAVADRGLFSDRRDPLARMAYGILEEGLRDPDPFVRGAAAKALSDAGTQIVLPLIEIALGDPDITVRLFAVEALPQLPVRDARRLIPASLSDPDASVRLTAIRVIAEAWPAGHAGEWLRPQLERAAGDPDGAVRLAALGALGLDGNVNTLSPFREALSDPQPETRLSAAFALGLTRHPTAAPLLMEALADPASSVRGHAAKALGELQAAEGIESLARVARDDSDPWVRSLAVTALSSLNGSDTAAHLRAAARDEDGLVRLSAGLALIEIGDRRGMDLLEEAFGHAEYGIRSGAARSVGELGHRAPAAIPPERAVKLLLPLLTDEVARVRAATVRALGWVGRPDVIPFLRAALSDSSPAVRCYASGAILRVKTRYSTEGGNPA